MFCSPPKPPLGVAPPPHVWRTLAVLGLCFGAACSGPTEPSPQPQPLALSCPTSITVEATQPSGAPATFDLPVARDGRPPYTIECSQPAAGTVFPVGQTVVDCSATDANQTRKACSFTVDVRVSQTLDKTRYLAFGDSITAGTVSPAPGLHENPSSYPYKLQHMLQDSYPAQNILVMNDGNGGERLREGAQRLPMELDIHKPEVLLLLQGIISVREIPTATNAGHLRTMISTARSKGVEVIIATVMPVGAGLEARQPGINAAVVRLNGEISRLAQEFGLGAPVNLYALFHAEPRLIGRDDLHPTEEGMTRIAEAFKDAVVSRYRKP